MRKYDLLINLLFKKDHFRVEKCFLDPENTKLAKSCEKFVIDCQAKGRRPNIGSSRQHE